VSYDVASTIHQSLVHGGNGGEFSEYSKAVADDSPPGRTRQTMLATSYDAM